jgi:hypothetical protein
MADIAKDKDRGIGKIWLYFCRYLGQDNVCESFGLILFLVALIDVLIEAHIEHKVPRSEAPESKSQLARNSLLAARKSCTSNQWHSQAQESRQFDRINNRDRSHMVSIEN